MNRRLFRRGLPGLLLLMMVSTSVRSEVSVFQTSGGLQILFIFGKDFEPDPFPMFGNVLQTPPPRILNESGDANGDGRPDFTMAAGIAPVVVWSYNDGNDYEIAFSQWNGAAWTGPDLLTQNTMDDLDPTVALDAAGLPVISWWRDEGTSRRVVSTRRLAGGAWETESTVSLVGEISITPTTTVPPADGRTRIAYEVEGAGVKGIVVARDDRTSGGPSVWVRELVAQTSYSGSTEPIIATRGSVTWVCWVHDAAQVGWGELIDGVWTGPFFEPYSGPGDIEAARFRVKNRLPH